LQEPVADGGFLLDENTNDNAGGFFRDDEESSEWQDYIALDLIPSALQILDLHPDDEDILAVFKSAASGWGGGNSSSQEVSRQDWRAVCAVLVAQRDPRVDDDPESAPSMNDFAGDPIEPAEEDESEGGDTEDEYRNEGNDDDEETSYTTSDEEFGAPPPKSTKKGGKPVDADQGPVRITSRQKSACRTAFALFFPEVEDSQLHKQRIMMKDVIRAAKLLKEKLTADEVRISLVD
jgi:hypothetical protein